jgi:hypothetical protein
MAPYDPDHMRALLQFWTMRPDYRLVVQEAAEPPSSASSHSAQAYRSQGASVRSLGASVTQVTGRCVPDDLAPLTNRFPQPQADGTWADLAGPRQARGSAASGGNAGVCGGCSRVTTNQLLYLTLRAILPSLAERSSGLTLQHWGKISRSTKIISRSSMAEQMQEAAFRRPP